MFTACFDAGDAGRTLPCTHLVTPIHHPSMTPEKRPAEDEEEQEEAPKKLKEDSQDTPPSVAEEATQEDDSSQDSVGSDSATSSDPQKKVHKERTLCVFFPFPGVLRVSWRCVGLMRTTIGWVTW